MPESRAERPTVAKQRALEAEVANLKAQLSGSSTSLSIDTSNVPIVHPAAYVDLGDYAALTSDSSSNEHKECLLFNIGEGKLAVQFPCNDLFLWDGVKLGEAIFAANLLPATPQEQLPDYPEH